MTGWSFPLFHSAPTFTITKRFLNDCNDDIDNEKTMITTKKTFTITKRFLRQMVAICVVRMVIMMMCKHVMLMMRMNTTLTLTIRKQ